MNANELALLGQAGQGPLRLYHLYRLLIGLSLVLLISSSLENQLLNVTHSRLFTLGSWGYLIINTLIILVMPRAERLAPLFALALFDVLLLSLLYYAAGGTPSGIGNLIVVAVAVANILLYRNIGLLIAAAGAAGIIYLTFYLSLSYPEASSQFMQAGMLGALCFAAALGVQALGRKLLTSQQLLEQQTTAVASLEALNAAIIARMRTGILVLDREFNILVQNQNAGTHAGNDGGIEGFKTGDCSSLLLQQLLAGQQFAPQRLHPKCGSKTQRTQHAGLHELAGCFRVAQAQVKSEVDNAGSSCCGDEQADIAVEQDIGDCYGNHYQITDTTGSTASGVIQQTEQ